MKTFEEADALIDATATLARKIKDVMVASSTKRPQKAAAYGPQRAAMRALLGDKSSGVDADLMTYATPSASRRALARRMVEIGQIRDPGEKAVARQQVLDLINAQHAYENFMDSMRPESYIDFVLASGLQHEGHANPKRVPSDEFLAKFATATSASIDLGKQYMPDNAAEELAKATAADAAGGAASIRMEDYAPEIAKKILEAQGLKNAVGRKWHAGQVEKERLRTERQAFARGTPEFNAANESLADALESQNALAKEFKRYEDKIARLQKKANTLWRDGRHQFGAGAEIRAQVGKSLIEKVNAASKVTEQEAREWADSRQVSDSARAALSRQGYDLQKFRADLADFYRFTNGRVRHVSFGTDGKGRANASGIGEHTTEGVINIGSSFPRSVLWHELGHYIEAETGVRYQTAQWIRGRATGKSYSLKSKFPNSKYGSSEVALPGPFFDEYAGKLYGDGMTEVVSMGLECLSDPHYLGKVLAKDPEHVQLVLGLLSRQPNEVERAAQSMRDMVLTAANQQAEAKESGVADWVSKLATLVKVSATATTMYDISSITHGMTSHQRESMTVVGVIEWNGPKPLNYTPPVMYLCKGNVRRGNGSSRLVKGYAIISSDSYFPTQLAGATLEQAAAGGAMALNGFNDVTMSTLQYLDTMKTIYEAATHV